jgi:DNA primase
MLVVEGYFDVVRLIGAGIESVVAPMGTALTEDQARLVRRYTDRVYLLYDSDKAGLKATFRSGDELLRQGASVQVVTLPEGEDPDSFVRAHGARGLEAKLGESLDLFERKIQLLDRGGWFSDLRRKRLALDRLLPTLRATVDPITRDLYLNHAAAAAGVSRELLEREVAAPPRGRTASAPRPASPPPPPTEPAARDASRVRHGERRRNTGARAIGAERELVRVLLHRPSYVEQVAERLGAESLHDLVLRRIYEAIVEQGPDADAAALAAGLDDEAVSEMQAQLEESGGLDRADEIVAGSLAALHERDLAARMDEIDALMPLASTEEKDALTLEKMQLSDELRALGSRRWKQFR